MADMSYSSTNQYLPPHQQYYPPSAMNNPVHIMPARPELGQRKRPKYTRSKTGCLTCRVKKIKCDETKPNCMRCTHGSRECSWPEGVPARKKSVTRRDDVDTRPSTAGSSGLSDASTPPGRDLTPPRRGHDISLLPLPSSRAQRYVLPPARSPPRRPDPSLSEGYLHMHPLNSDHEPSRRQVDRGSDYSHSHSHSGSTLSMIPESSYASRYDQSYMSSSSHSQSSRHALSSAPYRNMSHQSASPWSHPSEPIDPYYHGHHGSVHERPLVGHASSPDHSHNRYQ